MKLFPNKYKIENTVEATFPSSYSSLFYIQLSNTWRWLYKTTIKFPGVFKQESRVVTGNFLASFRKHLYRSLRKTNKHAESAYALSAIFRWLLWPTVTGSTSPIMSAIWHFNKTVTQRKILERIRHHKHLFVTGARSKQMVRDTFSGAWDSFNLKKKNFVFWKYFSPGISSSQDEAKEYRYFT